MAGEKRLHDYDLTAAERNRSRIIQIGLTAVVVVSAVALTLYITTAGEQKLSADGPKPIRVTSGALITQEGSPEPKVVLSIYEDFLCPHCREFEQQFGPTMSQLVEAGTIAADYYMVGILDRPQNQNYSSRAGSAAYCVADQSTDTFIRFHAALYAQQPSETATKFPTNIQLAETARQAGAESGTADCIKSDRYVGMVQRLAQSTGVTATPTVRINGQDYQFTTPEVLADKVRQIAGQ